MSKLNELKPEQAFLNEAASLKTPLDAVRKVQRTTQKTWDYNLGPNSNLSKELDMLVKRVSAGDQDEEAMTKSIDSMLSKLRGTKRKLAQLGTDASSVISTTQLRLAYMSSMPESTESPNYAPWSRKRLAISLADYLSRSPQLKETAKVLAQEEAIVDQVDFGVWDELEKAENGIKNGKLSDVLAWINDNKSQLKKMKSSLEFEVHLQAFIEMCRQRAPDKAIKYARANLSPLLAGDGCTVEQIALMKKAMALLAFGPDTTCPVYQGLYSDKRNEYLLAQLRKTFLQLHNLPSIPTLHLSLQAGLASLKTPTCIPPPGEEDERAQLEATIATKKGANLYAERYRHCPICSSSLKVLSREVPYSHHVNSTILCPIRRKAVGEDDESGGLYAIVGREDGIGRVYSKRGLEELLVDAPGASAGAVRDPVDGAIYEWTELKRVYIS